VTREAFRVDAQVGLADVVVPNQLLGWSDNQTNSSVLIDSWTMPGGGR
jgi:hypothetical protein